MKLEGSVAIVTGGARGIGKAITKALLQSKAKVSLINAELLYINVGFFLGL